MGTKRRYISKVYKTKVDMKEAVIELSANAFKLLNLIYYNIIKDETLADNEAMKTLGVSRRPYYRAKDELKEKGYIKVIQVGSTKYKWFVGKEAIRKDKHKYKAKKKKDDEHFADLVLNYNCPKKEKNYSLDNEGVFVLEGFEQNSINEIVV
jgi:hypothetical protein